MSDDVICKACETYARLGREMRAGEMFLDDCQCLGVRRFVLYGAAPTTRREVDKIAKFLKKAYELEEKRGPKKKSITFVEVMNAIKSLSDPMTLTEVAATLKVSEKTVQRAIEPLRKFNESWGTFEGLRAAIKSKEKPQFKKTFFKKLPRRRK